MARLIVLLLIALLPLRGWSATGMAVQMALAGNTAMESSMDAGQGAMPVDCPMMQKAASAVGDAAHTPEKTMDGKSHQGCQTCQLCMTLATLDSLSAKLPEPEPFGSPIALADRYAGAELFEDSKPPIS